MEKYTPKQDTSMTTLSSKITVANMLKRPWIEDVYDSPDEVWERITEFIKEKIELEQTITETEIRLSLNLKKSTLDSWYEFDEENPYRLILERIDDISNAEAIKGAINGKFNAQFVKTMLQQSGHWKSDKQIIESDNKTELSGGFDITIIDCSEYEAGELAED